MKTIIIGGDFKETPKASSVITKLSNNFYKPNIINGGTTEDIASIDISGNDLIIWAPNIDNELEKHYPKKDTGSVLICSKVIHSDRTELDAITRIFKMNGNAVVAISPGEKFNFKLIDALGNVWYNGDNINELSASIKNIYIWTKSSTRQKTKNRDFEESINSNLEKLVELNKIVADKFELSCGRFFGNSSTRCMKMFPSEREGDYILVSKRNVDKKRLTTDDFVNVWFDGETVFYKGNNKPSVDTPIQVNIYKNNPNINYMIHGHSYIKGFPFTKNYFPCGDLREFYEVNKYINSNTGGINLLNHGFLLYSETIEELEQLVSNLEFQERKIGEELANTSFDLEVYGELCCDLCNNVIHNHIKCDICGYGYSGTDKYCYLYEETELTCEECNTTYEKIEGSWYSGCKVKIKN